MDRYFESGASATPPSAPVLGSTGYPTDGNLATSTPPTTPGAWWFYMVTEELRAVIAAGGQAPNPNALQLLAALDARYTPPNARVVSLWSFCNAAAMSASGTINYQSAGAAPIGAAYSGGVVTVRLAGNYVISAAATLGYNGGAAGAKGTLTIYQNGIATPFTNYWQEQNNTIEVSTVSVNAVIACAAGDLISVVFTNQSSCNVFPGAGSFTGHQL